LKRLFLVIGVVVAASITLGLVLARMPRHGIERNPGSDTAQSTRDPELAVAVIHAKRDLPKFIKALTEHPEGQYAINARFETPQGAEQIWVRVTGYEKGVFQGALASDPSRLKGKAKGDPVEVKEGDVSDWTYRLDGQTYGGFTTRILNRK
jgi:uncharacterized protein YegJ (DUF2314 family)